MAVQGELGDATAKRTIGAAHATTRKLVETLLGKVATTALETSWSSCGSPSEFSTLGGIEERDGTSGPEVEMARAAMREAGEEHRSGLQTILLGPRRTTVAQETEYRVKPSCGHSVGLLHAIDYLGQRTDYGGRDV